jgi:hypothetical protein
VVATRLLLLRLQLAPLRLQRQHRAVRVRDARCGDAKRQRVRRGSARGDKRANDRARSTRAPSAAAALPPRALFFMLLPIAARAAARRRPSRARAEASLDARLRSDGRRVASSAQALQKSARDEAGWRWASGQGERAKAATCTGLSRVRRVARTSERYAT